jgi:hypothetical protein
LKFKAIIKFILLIFLLFWFPLLGLILSGKSIEKYVEFPPVVHYTVHAPFSWTVFVLLSAIIFIFILPIIIYSIQYLIQNKIEPAQINKIPWWGKLSILSTIVFWIIAWGQFDILTGIHEYTFFPLWLSFTILINSLDYKKNGKSFMTEHPARFLLLFPVSGIFWWYFEYMNGFVQNWYYVGADYGRLKIFLLSTLAFSTVLPAVSSISSLLSSYSWIKKGFTGIWKIQNPMPKFSAFLIFIFSSIGLALIGLFPTYIFPLVWISPLLIIVSMQIFFNDEHIFSDISEGNWSIIVSASVAALICGVFWEMWNYYSMPKWQYSIPLVHRFLIFEMPVLGYSGYLPFGLLCISISEMIRFKHD